MVLVTVTSLGSRVFTNVIKLRLSGKYHPGYKVDHKSNDWCPYKRKEREVRHRDMGEGNMKMEAEIGVICLQAKKC